MTEADFLAALHADPRDATACAMYADWLRERGRDHEAEVIATMPRVPANVGERIRAMGGVRGAIIALDRHATHAVAAAFMGRPTESQPVIDGRHGGTLIALAIPTGDGAVELSIHRAGLGGHAPAYAVPEATAANEIRRWRVEPRTLWRELADGLSASPY